jgi:hypothetical protein
MILKFVLCGLIYVSATATATATAKERPLFQSDTVLKAVLTAPITQTYAQRIQDVRIYFPGQWTYVEDDGSRQTLEVSIRTRGRFRREYCNSPPLRLNFKKSEVKGTLFTGQDKLKIVAPCKYTRWHRQYVVLEYLAYRTFEIITDHSFKTRMVRLSYIDSDEKMDPRTEIAFLVEDDSELAKRLGLRRVRVPKVAYDDLESSRTALVQLFQFLIANNDYSLLRGEGAECCHNIQMLGSKEDDDIRIPVPFDFDASGLVNANYAAPPRQVPVNDVRTRYYFGLCQPREFVDDAIAHMRSKRDEIVALYTNSVELDARHKKKTLNYIGEFFTILESPELTETQIIARCRGKERMNRALEASTD